MEVAGVSVMGSRRELRVVMKLVVRVMVSGSRRAGERRMSERVVERHWFSASSGPSRTNMLDMHFS